MVTSSVGEESARQICYDAKKLKQSAYVAVATWMQSAVVVVAI